MKLLKISTYQLAEIEEIQTIQLHKGAKILTGRIYANEIELVVLEPPRTHKEKRSFRLQTTADVVPENYIYITTVYDTHLFEVPIEAKTPKQSKIPLKTKKYTNIEYNHMRSVLDD